MYVPTVDGREENCCLAFFSTLSRLVAAKSRARPSRSASDSSVILRFRLHS